MTKEEMAKRIIEILEDLGIIPKLPEDEEPAAEK